MRHIGRQTPHPFWVRQCSLSIYLSVQLHRNPWRISASASSVQLWDQQSQRLHQCTQQMLGANLGQDSLGVTQGCVCQGGADTVSIGKHLPIPFAKASSRTGQMEGLGSVAQIFFQIRLGLASERKQNSSLKVQKGHQHFNLDVTNYSIDVLRWSPMTSQKGTGQKQHVICRHVS